MLLFVVDLGNVVVIDVVDVVVVVVFQAYNNSFRCAVENAVV